MHLGGWKSEKMVLRYAHLNVDHLAGSIANMPSLKTRRRTAKPVTRRTKSVQASRQNRKSAGF